MDRGISAALRTGRAVGILVLLWAGGNAISTSAKPQPLGKHRPARGLASSSISSLSSSLSGNCSSELLDCSHNETCLACISSGHVNTADCRRLYPAQNDSDSTYCHTIASAYCCAAYKIPEYSIACVDSELVIDYWTCTLAANGCTADDLPCFGDDAFIPAAANLSYTSSMTSYYYADDGASVSSGATRTTPTPNAVTLVASCCVNVALALVVGLMKFWQNAGF